jgi:hypothetical protein
MPASRKLPEFQRRELPLQLVRPQPVVGATNEPPEATRHFQPSILIY